MCTKSVPHVAIQLQESSQNPAPLEYDLALLVCLIEDSDPMVQARAISLLASLIGTIEPPSSEGALKIALGHSASTPTMLGSINLDNRVITFNSKIALGAAMLQLSHADQAIRQAACRTAGNAAYSAPELYPFLRPAIPFLAGMLNREGSARLRINAAG
ncbi:unnamed protein product [Protopolystoma xenopodis]|uniref:Uncharacterized protein n=1 Tax=Protopolystoma xenopodis TaxID=117903 RepID=A0A3S5A3B8_9PLAT|nr:unnamed protein product [Protopolystoma xenopodis]